MAMDMKELYWAAGFLEGEGSFYFGKPSKLLVQAAQVQKEPLERLQKFFGGNLRFCDFANRSPKASPYWVWNVASPSKAAGIMMTLFSLMSPRRQEQIKKALSGWKTTAVRLIRECPHGVLKTKCVPCQRKWSRENYAKHREHKAAQSLARYYRQKATL